MSFQEMTHLTVHRSRLSISRWRLLTLLGGIAAVLLAVGLAVNPAGYAVVPDLVASAWSQLHGLPWTAAPLLLMIAAVYYLATAAGVVAASTTPLSFRVTLRVQLAASAANRIAPSGLGAAAVNTRYLSRAGASVRTAIGTIAAISLAGVLAQLVVVGGLVLVGPALGISGGADEIGTLTGRLTAPLVAAVRWPLWCQLLVLGFVVIALAALVIRRHRRGQQHARDARDELLMTAKHLAAHPRRLMVLFAASGATATLMAFGFVVTARLADSPSTASSGALFIGYLLGGAAGAVGPTPSGVGTTDAALTAVLTISGMPLGSAVQAVLLFRLVTFWLPPALGAVLLPGLRKNHVL
jgi:uncharacterized membrane protein YbhN (UPF0104 family)